MLSLSFFLFVFYFFSYCSSREAGLQEEEHILICWNIIFLGRLYRVELCDSKFTDITFIKVNGFIK